MQLPAKLREILPRESFVLQQNLTELLDVVAVIKDVPFEAVAEELFAAASEQLQLHWNIVLLLLVVGLYRREVHQVMLVAPQQRLVA